MSARVISPPERVHRVRISPAGSTWKKGCPLSETTVKSHVASVLAKLGVATRVQAVVFAYEAGVSAEVTAAGPA